MTYDGTKFRLPLISFQIYTTLKHKLVSKENQNGPFKNTILKPLQKQFRSYKDLV